MDTDALNEHIAALQSHKDEWARLPVRCKIELLKHARNALKQAAPEWVNMCVRAICRASSLPPCAGNTEADAW